ncbi:LysO family transporter [Lutibacter sp. B2]|nr:LysO family transporter [Lutibacter sp. B2]
MWSILVVLGIGITIGVKVKLSEKFKACNAKLQQYGVILLLFIMGATMGLNKSLLSNLKNIGLKAFIFAILTSLLSLIIVYSISKSAVKEGSKQ